MSKRILVVEDDASVRDLVCSALVEKGYDVSWVETIGKGLETLRAGPPDLVVLDVMLPDGSGYDLCREARLSKATRTLPIIMLTAQGRPDEKAAGFGAGADTYLVKPLAVPELLLWVDALLRRRKMDAGESGLLEAGDLVVDEAAHLIRFRGAALPDLTNKEFELFVHLVKHRPQTFSRDYVLSKVWRTVAVDHLVDTHIGNLRRRLPPELADRLQTVPGKGFRYFE